MDNAIKQEIKQKNNSQSAEEKIMDRFEIKEEYSEQLKVREIRIRQIMKHCVQIKRQ